MAVWWNQKLYCGEMFGLPVVTRRNSSWEQTYVIQLVVHVKRKQKMLLGITTISYIMLVRFVDPDTGIKSNLCYPHVSCAYTCLIYVYVNNTAWCLLFVFSCFLNREMSHRSYEKTLGSNIKTSYCRKTSNKRQKKIKIWVIINVCSTYSPWS